VRTAYAAALDGGWTTTLQNDAGLKAPRHRRSDGARRSRTRPSAPESTSSRQPPGTECAHPVQRTVSSTSGGPPCTTGPARAVRTVNGGPAAPQRPTSAAASRSGARTTRAVRCKFAADNYDTATVGRDGVDVLATMTVPTGLNRYFSTHPNEVDRLHRQRTDPHTPTDWVTGSDSSPDN